MIDEFLKDLERPTMNYAISGKSFPKIADIPLLTKPARRRVEVLVYADDKKWWRQSGVDIGKNTAKIQLGTDTTKKGARYSIVAMTTEKPLAQQTYLNLPEYRTNKDSVEKLAVAWLSCESISCAVVMTATNSTLKSRLARFSCKCERC